MEYEAEREIGSVFTVQLKDLSKVTLEVVQGVSCTNCFFDNNRCPAGTSMVGLGGLLIP